MIMELVTGYGRLIATYESRVCADVAPMELVTICSCGCVRPVDLPHGMTRELQQAWNLAMGLHAAQCLAFGFGSLAPGWDELSLTDRVDWWVSADKRMHPESYVTIDEGWQ